MNQSSSQPSNALRSSSNYGYVVVAACFCIVMLNVGMFITLGVFFKPIMNDLGWTRAVTSVPFAMTTLVTGAGFLITGALADRFGPRLVISICVIITGAGYLLMARLSSIWELYLYIGFMSGLGSSALVPMQSTVTRWFAHRRTIMVGIVSAGGGVGGLIIPLLADWLIRAYTWRTAYLVLGTIYLVFTVVASQLLRKSPAVEKPAVAVAPSGQAAQEPESRVKNLFLSSRFWLINLVFFCLGVAVLVVQLHIVNHATDINISTTGAAGLLSIINGVSIVSSVLLGALGDRYGNRIMVMLCFVMMGLCMFSLCFMTSLWQLDIFAVVFGIALGAELSNSPALVSKICNIAILGLVLGISNLFQTVSGAFSGFLAGFIFDLQNSYNTMFIICAVVCLVGLTAAFFLKTPKSRYRF